MWKLVKISQQTYFIYCNFNTDKQDVTFILYDLKHTWYQTLTLNEVKQKVKVLNKRRDFSEENIKEALTSDNVQFAAIEDEPHGSAIQLDNLVLKLKYPVKKCLLNYEWNLKKQSVAQFQNIFVYPLVTALLCCHEQIETLTECIRKKDIELNQYRIEAGNLNRKTVSTKPFAFDDFNKKYENNNKIAVHFRELAKYLKENNFNKVPDTIDKQLNVSNIEEDINSQQKVNEVSNTKMSPRQRKRKVKDIKQQHLEQHLKIRKQGLEYVSSQSQTPSSDNSQTTVENNLKDIQQQEKQCPSKEIKGRKSNTPSPRKTARCAPTKQKWEYISSEDKTDSDNDGSQGNLKDQKSSPHITHNNNITSNKKETTKKSQNANDGKTTTRNCAKSLNLSYNCLTKSPEKFSESSNVFDFSTDTEDYETLKEKNKLLKAKRTLSSFGKSHCNLSNIISEVKNKSPTHKNKNSVESTIYKVIENISDTDDDTPLLRRKELLSKKANVHNTSCEIENLSFSSTLPRGKNLSHSPTPVVIDDLSSQLNNIRKELECLEAMRLADLRFKTTTI